MNPTLEYEGPKLRAWMEPYCGGAHRYIALLVESRGPAGFSIGQPIVLRKMKPEEDGYGPAPTLRISSGSAQQLMDDLWNCGLRPSEGSGSAGQLASVQKHLDDMRRISFHKLGLDKPGSE